MGLVSWERVFESEGGKLEKATSESVSIAMADANAKLSYEASKLSIFKALSEKVFGTDFLIAAWQLTQTYSLPWTSRMF